MTIALITAAFGSKAFWLLYLWLASAWGASELSKRKGYGEKWGLGCGLILSAIGVVIWLIVPPKPDSPWMQKRRRDAANEGEEPTSV
ncbi:MAG TPA: hypothetical protein VFG42_20700 [Baekduia sp.]|uniref:hypothetical protein n=1 Tax=Baekduia sp. TaxID=2600305 RepID=UPI002D799D8E|nr:hypothetical protein [Baekduia sp.]HET6509228.1 hypothetical protein [Baekduia sp.]